RRSSANSRPHHPTVGHRVQARSSTAVGSPRGAAGHRKYPPQPGDPPQTHPTSASTNSPNHETAENRQTGSQSQNPDPGTRTGHSLDSLGNSVRGDSEA